MLEGGLLKESAGHLAPELVSDDPKRDGQFVLGEKRAGEVPGLTSMHTLFIREHNRIARELTDLGMAGDEETYQAARRIVGAEMQNVVYREYLQALGVPSPLPEPGKLSSYNESVDPSVTNEFATAAFRFGHSMVQGKVELEAAVASPRRLAPYRLRDNFFDPTAHQYKTHFPDILHTFARMPSQACDLLFASDVRDHLFLNVEKRDGVLGNLSAAVGAPDLAARNLQRGREHGLPGYNAYRRLCGLDPACSWKSRPEEIRSETWSNLEALYGDPDDIDLFTAGLAERPLDGGAIAGPTFTCLMEKEFGNLMFGDRFFFTHRDNPNPFSAEQLEALRKRSLADIMCDNLPLRELQEKVFVRDSPKRSCSARNFLNVGLFL